MDIVIYIALGVLFLILVILANQFLPKLIINQRKKKHEEILRIYSNDINKLKFNCYESLNKLQAQGYPVKLRNLTTLVTLKHKNGYKTAELAYDENQSLMVIFHNDYSIPHAFYCHDLNACEVLINSEEDGGNKLLNAVLFVLHLLINIAFIFFPKIKAALGVASSLIDVGTELIPQSIENVSKLSI